MNRSGTATRPRRRRVEFDGGPASILELGDPAARGVPVLLLHGFAGDLLTWQFNISALAAARRAIAVDLPGHGESTLDVGEGDVAAFAPWLERLLDALALPRVHVVGHSMGGFVALDLGRRAPQRVASLSLVACAGLGPSFDLPLLRRIPRLTSQEEAEAVARRLFARPSPLADRIAHLLLARASDPPRRAALEAIVEGSFARTARDGAPPVDWAALPMPVQLLWGRDDAVIPLATPDRLPRNAPLHLFDNAGHLPHSEAAGRVTATLADFLAAADP